MKVQVRLAIMEGYSSIHEEKVEVEVDHLDKPVDVQLAVEKVLQLAENRGMFKPSYDHAVNLYIKLREHYIRNEAAKQAKLDAAPDMKAWQLQSKITELESALARKECQIDGMIKGINPDYVAQPDKTNTQDL